MTPLPFVSDWYGTTIPGQSADHIRDTITAAISPVVTVMDLSRVASGEGGYGLRERASDGVGDRIFELLSGGYNGTPHLRCSGGYCEAVVDAVRAHFPRHSVSRWDVALDLIGPSCFEKVHDIALELAKSRALKWSTVGDFREDGVRELTGRTVYLGSRQSEVMIRIYEKGLMELQRWEGRGDEKPPPTDWVRIELEYKPKTRRARENAAGLTKERVWGCSPGSRDMLRRVVHLDVERVSMNLRREPDAERSTRHAAVQYRAAFQQMIDERGEAGFIEFIQAVWAEMDRQHKAA